MCLGSGSFKVEGEVGGCHLKGDSIQSVLCLAIVSLQSTMVGSFSLSFFDILESAYCFVSRQFLVPYQYKQQFTRY